MYVVGDVLLQLADQVNNALWGSGTTLMVGRASDPIRLNLEINSGTFEPLISCLATTAGRVNFVLGFIGGNTPFVSLTVHLYKYMYMISCNVPYDTRITLLLAPKRPSKLG